MEIDLDSEHRCQAVKRTHQCVSARHILSDGTESLYCYSCGGWRDEKKIQRRNFSLYTVERYKKKIDKLASHESAKSLDDEVAILRMTLEDLLNNQQDLQVKTPMVLNLVDRILKAVPTAHKLDLQVGNSFSLKKANQMADEIITIMGNYIEDTEILSKISTEISSAISRATCEEDYED